MPQRTLENCKLVTQYGTPNQYDGKCEGFARNEHDDEPCEICKRCKLHYINQEERGFIVVTKVEFSEIAFIDFLHFLLSEDKAKESFKTMSGFDLKTLGSRSPLDKMIDDATGYEQDIMSNFVIWAAENFWDEPEKLEQIEVYKKAKEHINNKI